MKNRKSLSVALIVIAILVILAISITVIVLSNSTGSAYDAGIASGKIVRPYLVGLGVIFLILILIRVVRKKV